MVKETKLAEQGVHIQSAEISNLGLLPYLDCKSFKGINLIIGKNNSGKTYLLKALYSSVRALEEYKRGDDIRQLSEILAEKIRWTFQADKLGDIVNRTGADSMSINLKISNEELSYKFTKDAASKIISLNNKDISPRSDNSVFIPAKEVLSLYSIIFKSREIDRVFGFDDTYYDLAKALRISLKTGKNFTTFSKSRQKLNKIINGKVEYDETGNKWYYKQKNSKFSINTTSEGIKKIAILDRLLGNGYLGKNSLIFIDEPESALHPNAVCEFLEILYKLSVEMGIQIFIASHSYFVIKKLALLAEKNQTDINCISINKDNIKIENMKNGMPNNSIIDESISLYEESIDLL